MTMCSRCDCEAATEFYGPTGEKIKRGLCKRCLEILINDPTKLRPGRMSKEDRAVKSAYGFGSEDKGRKMRDNMAVAGDPSNNDDMIEG